MKSGKPLRVLICPDSFKGSLSAAEAAAAIDRGVRSAFGHAEVYTTLLPLADGGEGTAEILLQSLGGSRVPVTVHDPLMRAIQSSFVLLADRNTAVVEMAAASGLCLLSDSERNPLYTSTYGTGELLGAALEIGVKRLLVCIGGSATNDGGSGAAAALGAAFYDASGNELPPGGIYLKDLHRLDISGFHFDPASVEVTVACDVTNPLIGPNGASAVYGPQKGATEEMVADLDLALARFGGVINETFHGNFIDMPGAGAAGGLGAGLSAFFAAKLVSGVDMVMDAVEFDKHLQHADIVVTGEGRVDSQTASGKVVGGVLEHCRSFGVPVVALAGSVQDSQALKNAGLLAAFSIAQGPITLEAAMENAGLLLEQTADSIFRVVREYF